MMFSNFSAQSVDCFSCNVRGLQNPGRLVEICNIVKNESKSKNKIITIQETKIQKLEEEHIKVLDKYNLKAEFVPARGTAGGLLTLFSKNLEMESVIKTEYVLALTIKPNGPTFCNVYINPKDYHLKPLSIACEDLEEHSSNGIFFAGDFNAIEPNEAKNGKTKNNDIRILRYLRTTRILNSFQMCDMGKALSMTEPTHFDKRTGASTRIDYFFGNMEINNAKMRLLSTSFSDHKCLHLSYFKADNHVGNGSWKLNNEILADELEIRKAIKDCFEETQNLAQNYDIFKMRLRNSLRKKCIQNAKEKKLTEIKLTTDVERSEKEMLRKQNHTKSELEEHEKKIEKLKTFRTNRAQLILRSIKNFYMDVNEGDPKSTKRLLGSLKETQEIKKIINSEGKTIQDEELILDEFANYFEKCFASPIDDVNIEQKRATRKSYLDRFFKDNEQKLKDFEEQSEVKNNEDEKFTEYEVEKAIMKLNSNSAPGSDGLTSDLYKTQKETFIPILTELFNNIHETKYVPPSFKHAIIKLIPKKPNDINIANFRPISLINTDEKILSHIIADRLRKVLDVLIGKHQTAHLTNRNINMSLMKLQKFATEMSKKEGIIALDFNKAFDKVNRNYMMEMIQRLPIDAQTKNIIEKTYEETLAFINIRGAFSLPFKTETGVRQGCPMSALIFNLAIEPLLQYIQKTNRIKSSEQDKSIAFADDISICMFLYSIKNLLKILKDFADMSDLTINIAKSKIITAGLIPSDLNQGLEKVKRTKILGIFINVGGKLDSETKTELMNTAYKTNKFVGPSVSLHARAKNIQTFILPKLIYLLRHYPSAKTFMKKLNAAIIDQLWLGKKHNVNQEIVNTPHQDGGIGLKNLQKAIITAKLMDLKNLVFNSLERSFLPLYKSSKIFKKLEVDMRRNGIEILEIRENKLCLQYYFQSFELTKESTSKELYKFLVKSIITIPCFRNINMSAMKLNISPNIVSDFLAKLWKNQRLRSFDKNILYNFLMNSYLDKQDKWLKDLVPHPLCFSCGVEFETFEHLMFKCQETTRVRNKLNIKTWRDVFTDRTSLAPKLLVAVILSSWSEEKGKYLKYLTK